MRKYFWLVLVLCSFYIRADYLSDHGHDHPEILTSSILKKIEQDILSYIPVHGYVQKDDFIIRTGRLLARICTDEESIPDCVSSTNQKINDFIGFGDTTSQYPIESKPNWIISNFLIKEARVLNGKLEKLTVESTITHESFIFNKQELIKAIEKNGPIIKNINLGNDSLEINKGI